MHYRWGFAALLAFWLSLLPGVEANPNLQFPVNAQVPPVARTSQSYIFVFSDSTFTSTDGLISYTLSGEPTWLQLISGTRTFSGTPGPQDAGAARFSLVATDSSGSTSASVTFVVVATSGLEVGQPVLPQLAKAGSISGPASLLLHPLQFFTFRFDAETFSNTNANTKFYAVSANNTPLPNWVQFDSSNLEFSGTSPQLVSSTATPQLYGIKLVASDVVGFSEATIDFQFVVGYHILTATDVFEAINTSPGKEFSSTEFRDGMTLDGQDVADSDIVSVTSNGPEWVSLDASTISLHGTPPANEVSTNITIIVLDVYGDELKLLVELTTEIDHSALFTGMLPDANTVAGEYFAYTIAANLLRDKQVQISTELGSASTWLGFSPESLTLHGKVPKQIQAGPVTITLTATEGNLSESKPFVINITPPLHTSSSSTRPASSTTMLRPSSPDSTASATSQSSPEGLLMPKGNTVRIILATVLPAFLIVLIICLILCWRRRRTKQRERHISTSQEAAVVPEARHTPTPEVVEVPPIPTTLERSPRSIPSRPPQIELPWAPDSMRTSKNKMSRRLRATAAPSFDSTWGNFIVTDTGSVLTRPLGSIQALNATENVSQDEVPSLREVAPNYSRKGSTRSTQPTRQISVPKRSSKRYSTMSIVSPGLPQRLSGAGHGAGGAPSPVFNELRSSWQTIMGTIPGLESKRSTVILNDFPSPPHDTNGRGATSVLQSRSPNRPPQSTLRMVRNDSTRSSGLQKWYTDRARDQLEGSARFSSASSRPSSSSRVLWEDSLGGRRISATLSSDDESSKNRNTQQAAFGIARRRTTSNLRLAGPSSYVRTPSKLRRDVSTASSGQFDSVMSAELWEDEDLIEEENEDGIRQWQRSEAGEISPRLPVEAVPTSQQGAASPIEQPRRWRLTDSENPVSLAEKHKKRSGTSEQGSLAFV